MALPARRPERGSRRAAATRTPIDPSAQEHPLAAPRGILVGSTIALTVFWAPLALAIRWLRA